MGIETALIAAAVGSQVAGGIGAQQQGKKQARRAEEESREKASIRADDVRAQIGRNITLFAKSGVQLQGSPLLSIEQDIETGRRDVQSILATGEATGKQLRAAGRQQLLGSIGGAFKTAAGAA